jgi:hypothetical protein
MFVDNLQLVCARVTLSDRPATGWVSPAFGGSGGNHFELSCNNNEVLVGITARAGWWLDAIAARCIAVGNDGSWTGNPRTTVSVGGTGGTAATTDCQRNQAVSEIRGRASAYVDRIRLSCRPLASRNVVEGTTTRLSEVGGTGGESFGPYACPSDLPATGFQGRAATWIDRMQMICGRP